MDGIRIGSVQNAPNSNISHLKNDHKVSNFDDFLQDAMGKIEEIQRNTELAVKELSQGGDITEAIISLEKADMSFQLMVEIRNRLLNAYEEIMRMQV